MLLLWASSGYAEDLQWPTRPTIVMLQQISLTTDVNTNTFSPQHYVLHDGSEEDSEQRRSDEEQFTRPSPQQEHERRIIICGSEEEEAAYCRTKMKGHVWLQKKLSREACREYDTWGADADGGGIWVRSNCRGVFVVEEWSTDPENQRRGKRRLLTCESEEGKDAYCPTLSAGRVRLHRQLSKAPCREYDTWGADPDGGGVWVRAGCQGIFGVVQWPSSVQGRGDRRAKAESKGMTITCQSQGFDYNHCDIALEGRSIRLESQLGETTCVQEENWGVDHDGIWVDEGCSGVFRIE